MQAFGVQSDVRTPGSQPVMSVEEVRNKTPSCTAKDSGIQSFLNKDRP